MHIGRILEMSESSPGQITYEQNVIEGFGGQQELDLAMPETSTASPQPSEQSLTDAAE